MVNAATLSHQRPGIQCLHTFTAQAKRSIPWGSTVGGYHLIGAAQKTMITMNVANVANLVADVMEKAWALAQVHSIPFTHGQILFINPPVSCMAAHAEQANVID